MCRARNSAAVCPGSKIHLAIVESPWSISYGIRQQQYCPSQVSWLLRRLRLELKERRNFLPLGAKPEGRGCVEIAIRGDADMGIANRTCDTADSCNYSNL